MLFKKDAHSDRIFIFTDTADHEIEKIVQEAQSISSYEVQKKAKEEVFSVINDDKLAGVNVIDYRTLSFVDLQALVEKLSLLIPKEQKEEVIILGADESIQCKLYVEKHGYRYLSLPYQLDSFAKELKASIEKYKFGETAKVSEGNKSAFRVAFIGAGGGVGVTTLAASLAKRLSEQIRSQLLLVNHNFDSKALRFQLSMNDEEANEVLQPMSQTITKEYVYSSLASTKKEQLRFLLPKLYESESYSEHSEKVSKMLAHIEHEFNFIIDDYSAYQQHVIDQQGIDRFLDNKDRVYIVTDNTIPAAQNALALYEKLVSASERYKKIVQFNIIVNQIGLRKNDILNDDMLKKVFSKPYIKFHFDNKLYTEVLSAKKNKYALPAKLDRDMGGFIENELNLGVSTKQVMPDYLEKLKKLLGRTK
ncbi:hypothetical protein [Fangia hongkongensis]|uniref:hypothetical protein n=1 Tax=Fangia hongkongensis TaxID=270495 RepID=UPI000360983B|nr:hypothetical protein [Fangia hongkongensis]MBK2124660.1 hypothetical protein [Fangia hongkongensis]